jgi:hypothetical protein
MLIESIAKYLDGLGYVNYIPVGYSTDNDVFFNYMPDEPNNVTCIRDTGGEGNIYNFFDSKRSVQVLVRNERSTLAHFQIWRVYKALINPNSGGFLFIDGRKMRIASKNQPISLGKDNNGLFEFSFNLDVYTQNDI